MQNLISIKPQISNIKHPNRPSSSKITPNTSSNGLFQDSITLSQDALNGTVPQNDGRQGLHKQLHDYSQATPKFGFLEHGFQYAAGVASRYKDLGAVSRGELETTAGSRLAAYKATSNHDRGSTGRAVNNAVGMFYTVMGRTGEDNVGHLFNSPEMKKHFSKPVRSDAPLQLSKLEHSYWKNQWKNEGTIGGLMGQTFGPSTRDLALKHIFSRF